MAIVHMHTLTEMHSKHKLAVSLMSEIAVLLLNDAFG